jgi:hypothetical protein
MVADEGGNTFDIISRLNATKACVHHSDSEGCASSNITGTPDVGWGLEVGPWEAQEAGVVLATGTSIFGFFNQERLDEGKGWGSSPEDRCKIDPNAPPSLPQCGDLVYIGLEQFPVKEYFYIHLNTSDTSTNLVPTPPVVDLFNVQSLYGTSQVPSRPGEIKCLSKNCLDMFK